MLGDGHVTSSNPQGGGLFDILSDYVLLGVSLLSLRYSMPVCQVWYGSSLPSSCVLHFDPRLQAEASARSNAPGMRPARCPKFMGLSSAAAFS